MATFFNTFESVPNATQISAGNSAGDAGSTALTSLTVPASGTLDGDTSKSAHGTHPGPEHKAIIDKYLGHTYGGYWGTMGDAL